MFTVPPFYLRAEMALGPLATCAGAEPMSLQQWCERHCSQPGQPAGHPAAVGIEADGSALWLQAPETLGGGAHWWWGAAVDARAGRVQADPASAARAVEELQDAGHIAVPWLLAPQAVTQVWRPIEAGRQPRRMVCALPVDDLREGIELLLPAWRSLQLCAPDDRALAAVAAQGGPARVVLDLEAGRAIRLALRIDRPAERTVQRLLTAVHTDEARLSRAEALLGLRQRLGLELGGTAETATCLLWSATA